MDTKRAELKAGIVVILAASVLLYFLWVTTGAEWPWTPHRTIHIRFEQGFAAPHLKDPVLMNGFEIGKVVAVVQREEERSGSALTRQDCDRLGIDFMDAAAKQAAKVREIYVVAAAELPMGQKIPRGTVAEITVNVTGSRTLALKPGVETVDLTDDDTKAHPILASAAGDLADIQRSVQALVNKVSTLVDSAKDALHDVRDLIATVKTKVDVIDLGEIQANVKDAAVSLKAALATANTRIDEITAKLNDAAASLKTAAGDAGGVVVQTGKDVQAMLAELKAAAAEIRALVQRVAPKVDAAIDDVARAARSVAALGRDLEGLGPRLHAIVGKAGNDIDAVLARLNEVGHNLADASEDLRAHPWKLLNKPDEKEIAYENLRNAASNYVRAAQAVEEAAKELRATEARTDVQGDDLKGLVEGALLRLKADLARYQEAEARFSELMKGR